MQMIKTKIGSNLSSIKKSIAFSIKSSIIIIKISIFNIENVFYCKKEKKYGEF